MIDSSQEKKPSFHPRQIFILALILLMFEIALLNSPGVGDRNRWLLYMDLARTHGIFQTYSIAVNNGVANGTPQLNLFNGHHFKNLTAIVGGIPTEYPPLGIVILGIFSRIADFFSISDFIALKISISLFMLGCAAIGAFWQKKWHPLFGLSVFVLLIPNGLMLSYIDSFFIFFFLLALLAFDKKRSGWGIAFFMISCLTKWQPIILAPFVLFFAFPRRLQWKNLSLLLPGALVGLVTYAIFGKDPWTAFVRGIDFPGDNHLSSLELNIHWIYTYFLELKDHALKNGLVESLNLGQYPLIERSLKAIAFLIYFVSLVKFIFSERKTGDFIEGCIMAFLAYGMFYTNVHENHLILVGVLGLFWAFFDRTRIFDAIMLSIIVNLNLYVFFGADGSGYTYSRKLLGIDFTIFIACINLLYVFTLIFSSFRISPALVAHLLSLLKHKFYPRQGLKERE